ncbi:hypothetical protein B0H14DRAFT_2735098 [Mycena olivaceomarginata]|nr:hypothetical protein B0H14DRAFT_2735098 [Mycena olivaceomarginata]
MASLYYSKWAFIDGLLPSLRAAREAGEDARLAAVHTAGRGIPVDLGDLGLKEAMGKGVRGARSLVGQLASYQILWQRRAFGERDPTNTFTHTFPGSVDTPILRASPSLALRIAHYVCLVLRIRGEMSIEECGERQLWGFKLSQAPPGGSRTGGDGASLPAAGAGDPTWAEAREKLWVFSEGVVGGVGI